MDLVFAMEDMERGLQEMAQSVEHMQEMLKRSPMVQALAQHKPEVRAPSALLSQNGRRGLTHINSCTRPAGGVTCTRLHFLPDVGGQHVVFVKNNIRKSTQME